MSLLSPTFVRVFSFTSSSLQKKRNVNKNARGHVTLFFILWFFMSEKKSSTLVGKKRNTHNQ